MLVTIDNGVCFATFYQDRNDLFRKKTCLLSRSSSLLTADSERILICARHRIRVRNVVRRLRHRIHPVSALHRRVYKPPADGGVFNFLRPSKCTFSLAHDIRSAGHRLDPTSYGQLHLTTCNSTKGCTNRIQSRGTQSIKGHTGDRLRQPRKQKGYTGYVAIVFTSLVSATEKNLIELRPVHSGIALDQSL
ncbi:hypothetical protein D3C87_1268420 [compost metagenome]